jgi:hypothetical protein
MMNLIKKTVNSRHTTIPDEYTYIFFNPIKKQLIPMMRLLKKWRSKTVLATIFCYFRRVGMDELGIQ